MELKNFFGLILAGLALLTLGGGVGYFMAPEKIKTVDKIVEKEVVKIVHEVYDPTTGKIIERTTTDETKNTTETNTKTQTLKPKKMYSLKLGAFKVATDTSMVKPRVGVEVRLPFFDTWLGAEGDISLDKPTIGLYGRFEF